MKPPSKPSARGTGDKSKAGHLPGEKMDKLATAAKAVEVGIGLFETVTNFCDRNQKKEQKSFEERQERFKKEEEEPWRINYLMKQEQERKEKEEEDERKKKEEEESQREEKERKKKHEEHQREMDLINQRIKLERERGRQLMEDTEKSLKEDHQIFLETKTIMEDTHRMEMNTHKIMVAATAELFRHTGYFENNGNQGGAHLKELEAIPNTQQMEDIETVNSMKREEPAGPSSFPQPSKCRKCHSSFVLNYCDHKYCPKCHVKDGTLYCRICQKSYTD